MIAGSYKSERPINFTSFDEVHLKCVCINDRIVNGVREPVLYSFALDQPAGKKIYKKPRINFFKRVKESVLSHITFYLEEDDHKPVDFNGETISFT